ncbi:hypothetical protein [Robiginitalea sp. SC105]|uniref:hypothetical protein n=1 Tax=Robiginitalea sp. SC105 TaxID=2762332 RepID=UPI00163A205A|nr:hypothetical protein [Robiginitalea sp. SC105]MBC2838991.1 hypothetical protein [Robiginitalea sp. SC105]
MRASSNILNASFILAMLFLMQSCIVYYPAPVKLEEAVMAETPVKIRRHADPTLRLKYLEEQQGQLLGHTRRGDTILIDRSEISEVLLMDKSASTHGTVLISILAGGVLIGLIAMGIWAANFSIGG